jgi:hypothetical protein
MPDLVLNELSFRRWDDFDQGFPCPDVHYARALMDALVKTVSTASRYQSIGKVLRTEVGFLQYPLSEGYSLVNWVNDREVDRDARTFFKNRAAKGVHVEPSTLTEVRFGGRPGSGLCAAWLSNGISLSLRSHEVWNGSLLGVTLREITNSGGFEETEKQVRHVSSAGHFAEHAAWLAGAQRSMVRSGADLLLQARTLFPSIEICGRALKQISDLTGGEPYFEWVLDCLDAGNRLVSEWSGGAFPHGKLPCPTSGESESVLNNEKWRDMRLFQTPAKEWKLFEWHMKHKSYNIRIHYLPDANKRVLMIGYVGKHLPTKDNPT